MIQPEQAAAFLNELEIVVLIRHAGQVIGQIDADADETAAFDATDEALLTAVADRLATLLAESGPR